MSPAGRQRLSAAEAALREAMLAYPETTEEFPWGERTAKVKGKIFVALDLEPEALRVTVKLPRSSQAALMLPFAAPTGYGLGRSGWVTATFQPGDEVPLALLKQWVDESFRAVAPKGVLRALDGAGADRPPAAAPARRARRRSPSPGGRTR